MTVSVLVPYRHDGGDRDRAWAWLQDWWADTHPDWQVVAGASPDGPFSRTAAILDAYRHAEGDVLVVADADIFCDDIDHAVAQVETMGWAIPHFLLHRLSRSSSKQVMAGADWRGLPLSSDNRQDSKPYRGFETGTLAVLARAVLDDVPPDYRFRGWGHEEEAWSAALRMLVGKPWRGAADLVHLWHPPQERQSRGLGTRENVELRRRYLQARTPTLMRALIEEAKHVDPARHDDDQRAATAR